MSLHSYVVMILQSLRAILRAWFSHPYPTMGRAPFGAQEASERARDAGASFSAQIQERLSMGSERPCEGLGVCPGREGRVRGSEASGELSGGSTAVVPGEPGDRQGSDTKHPRQCQEVNPKRDKFLNLLTVIKIRCYNSRFSGNGHFGYFVYVRFMGIYHDISAYSRQNGHNRQKVQNRLTGQNGQIGNVGYFRPYTTLYHQSMGSPDPSDKPDMRLPYTKSLHGLVSGQSL